MEISEETLVNEIQQLRELLRKKEIMLADIKRTKQIFQEYGLNNEEIARYSRQIFLPEIGVQVLPDFANDVLGQKSIKEASALIVGIGGLGCPAALYLTCSGIGHIGIVDYDNVEINNLHRQVLFKESDVGIPKVIAAEENLKRINSDTKISTYKLQLDSKNALDIVKQYDVVLDATDNAATRYLLNDACFFSGKPLISGSALKFEGHLSVFNYRGPCYRCIFPKPPPPETVTNCGDGGVLGAAVGTIGILQALEAIKIILNMPGVLSKQLLLFDGIETKFRSIHLRSKNSNCDICGNNPTVHKLIDYEEFCGSKANDKNPNLNLLENGDRITVEEYNELLKLGLPDLLIDVRSPEEFQICKLNNSINIPLKDIINNDSVQLIKNRVEKIRKQKDTINAYILCRRGNDSQKAVKHLQKVFQNENFIVKDIIGGIHAWSSKIDPMIPIY